MRTSFCLLGPPKNLQVKIHTMLLSHFFFSIVQVGALHLLSEQCVSRIMKEFEKSKQVESDGSENSCFIGFKT